MACFISYLNPHASLGTVLTKLSMWSCHITVFNVLIWVAVVFSVYQRISFLDFAKSTAFAWIAFVRSTKTYWYILCLTWRLVYHVWTATRAGEHFHKILTWYKQSGRSCLSSHSLLWLCYLGGFTTEWQARTWVFHLIILHLSGVICLSSQAVTEKRRYNTKRNMILAHICSLFKYSPKVLDNNFEICCQDRQNTGF